MAPDQRRYFEEGKQWLLRLGFQLAEAGHDAVAVRGDFGPSMPTSGMYSIDNPSIVMTQRGYVHLGQLRVQASSATPVGTEEAAISHPRATSSQEPSPEGVASEGKIVEHGLGRCVRFIATDDTSQLDNPKSWPQVDTSLLAADCEGNGGQEEGKFSWYLDKFKNCIDVCQEAGREYPTSRFYNKRRQGICYAYAVDRRYNPRENEVLVTMKELVWRRDQDLKTAAELKACLQLHPSRPEFEATVVEGQADQVYLVAKGAANFPAASSIPAGQGYRSPKAVKVDPGQGVDVNGLRLERALFEAGRVCRKAYGLARTLDSFNDARMWNLTRDSEVQGKQFTLTVLDIGVRSRCSPHRDLGWENHPEEQYHAHMAKVANVRLFVALIPDSLDKDPPGVKNLINVVLLQDVLPVEGELHIIYLIHHTGSYYSQPVYENVKLVDVDLSGEAERLVFLNHIKDLLRGRSDQATDEFVALEPLDESQGCGQDVNEQRDVVFKLRGFHNEFWKRVVEPARAGVGSEQEALFKRWQPFYMHDFSPKNYLAEPLGNFKPEEIHVVNMAQLIITCDQAFEKIRLSERKSNGARFFLSGIGSDFNSGLESVQVQQDTFMIQVEVPDDKIRCVIYDFAHMEYAVSLEFYRHGERDTLGYFRYLNTLTFNGRGLPPVPFVTRNVGRRPPQDPLSFESLSQQETNLSLIECPANMADPLDVTGQAMFQFRGKIAETHFHFVSSVDIENKVKVGVANLPLSCRAFTVNSRQLCENLICRAPHNMPPSYRQQRPPNGRTPGKLHVRGAVWADEDQFKIVGIADSNESSLSVLRPIFQRTSQEDPRNHTAVWLGQLFEHNMDYCIGDLKPGSHVLTVSFNPTGSSTSEKGNLSHNLRKISCPVFDVVKGYPVQGFYRNFQLRLIDAQHDEVYSVVHFKKKVTLDRAKRTTSQVTPYQSLAQGRPHAYSDPTGTRNSGPSPHGGGWKYASSTQWLLGHGSDPSLGQSATSMTLAVASLLSAAAAVQLFI
ncbi:hypothetical protein HDE_03456 [Halotydeus destructor]|nr:hypothetical protein HDE_03456 [Halotydeus destructor]